jgi:hypothetical protein
MTEMESFRRYRFELECSLASYSENALTPRYLSELIRVDAEIARLTPSEHPRTIKLDPHPCAGSQ